MAGRRRSILTGMAAVVGVSLLAGCSVVARVPFRPVTPPARAEAPAPGSAPATALGDRVGITAGSSILWDTPTVRQRKLQAVADSGAKWFASDVNWAVIQGAGPNSFDWAATDRVVQDARAKGLKVLAGISYSPAWARPSSCPAGSDKCFPASPEYYADFARAAAQRYGVASPIPSLRGSIEAWQVWNEPNNHVFAQPTINVAAYTTMLKRAYVEIKKVDPGATVLAGGTSPAGDDPSGQNMAPITFLRQIYQNGGKGFFDAFAHHPYSFPCSPLYPASWNAFGQTPLLHQVMVTNGDGAKKIWGTEAGAPTGADVSQCMGPGMSVTEAQQAQWVTDYFKGWFGTYGSFTGPLFWYQIQDNGTNPNYYDDHFGLLRRDFSPKPAYGTLQRLAQGT